MNSCIIAIASARGLPAHELQSTGGVIPAMEFPPVPGGVRFHVMCETSMRSHVWLWPDKCRRRNGGGSGGAGVGAYVDLQATPMVPSGER